MSAEADTLRACRWLMSSLLWLMVVESVPSLAQAPPLSASAELARQFVVGAYPGVDSEA
jgi:hypothetical protein